MRLYHYTSVFHLIKIMEDHYINTTKSNDRCPDIVWLTSNRNPHKEKNLMAIVDKRQVRMTVDNQAIQYLHWAKKNNVSTVEIEALNKAGGYQNHRWFVLERPIPEAEWMSIELFDDILHKWTAYSLELHKKLIGKIRVNKYADGTMEVADKKSALIVQMMEHLNGKSNFEIEMEIMNK